MVNDVSRFVNFFGISGLQVPLLAGPASAPATSLPVAQVPMDPSLKMHLEGGVAAIGDINNLLSLYMQYFDKLEQTDINDLQSSFSNNYKAQYLYELIRIIEEDKLHKALVRYFLETVPGKDKEEKIKWLDNIRLGLLKGQSFNIPRDNQKARKRWLSVIRRRRVESLTEKQKNILSFFTIMVSKKSKLLNLNPKTKASLNGEIRKKALDAVYDVFGKPVFTKVRKNISPVVAEENYIPSLADKFSTSLRTRVDLSPKFDRRENIIFDVDYTLSGKTDKYSCYVLPFAGIVIYTKKNGTLNTPVFISKLLNENDRSISSDPIAKLVMKEARKQLLDKTKVSATSALVWKTSQLALLLTYQNLLSDLNAVIKKTKSIDNNKTTFIIAINNLYIKLEQLIKVGTQNGDLPDSFSALKQRIERLSNGFQSNGSKYESLSKLQDQLDVEIRRINWQQAVRRKGDTSSLTPKVKPASQPTSLTTAGWFSKHGRIGFDISVRMNWADLDKDSPDRGLRLAKQYDPTLGALQVGAYIGLRGAGRTNAWFNGDVSATAMGSSEFQSKHAANIRLGIENFSFNVGQRKGVYGGLSGEIQYNPTWTTFPTIADPDTAGESFGGNGGLFIGGNWDSFGFRLFGGFEAQRANVKNRSYLKQYSPYAKNGFLLDLRLRAKQFFNLYATFRHGTESLDWQVPNYDGYAPTKMSGSYTSFDVGANLTLERFEAQAWYRYSVAGLPFGPTASEKDSSIPQPPFLHETGCSIIGNPVAGFWFGLRADVYNPDKYFYNLNVVGSVPLLYRFSNGLELSLIIRLRWQRYLMITESIKGTGFESAPAFESIFGLKGHWGPN